jgi:putative membrane protein
MKRATFLLSASLLLSAACTSTNPETEQASAARAEAAQNRPPGGSEVLGAYDPGTPEATPATTAQALQQFSDAEFLLTAASSNQLEIQLGQLAAQQAEAEPVRKFGQMMADHHTTAAQELSSLAAQLDVRPSVAIMPMHQELIDRLKNKTGRAFDERYMDVMETAHKLDVVMFEAKSKKAETPTVQDYAARILPTLRTHLEEANAVEKQVD